MTCKKYTKKIKIDINKIDIFSQKDRIGISGSLVIAYYRKIDINFFLDFDDIKKWKLNVFDSKLKRWVHSSCFPKQLRFTAWDDGVIMTWISRNIESILFLAGERRDIIYED